MDQTSPVEIAERFAQKVRGEFNVVKVVLFGSAINGTFLEDSDIDIAVVVKSVEGNLFQAKARLCGSTADVDIRIEPVLWVEGGPDPSGFREHILKTGHVVYQAEADCAS